MVAKKSLQKTISTSYKVELALENGSSSKTSEILATKALAVRATVSGDVQYSLTDENY